MPDLQKLHSFLTRTQKAMQDAINRGDQAGVDQYENYLDRATSVAERHLGQQSQPISNLPQPPQEPPQLMAGPGGDGPPPVNKIQKDLEGETGSSHDPASSALDSILSIARPSAFEQQKADTLASIDKTLAYGKELDEDRKVDEMIRRTHSDTPRNTLNGLGNNGPDYARMAGAFGGAGMVPGGSVKPILEEARDTENPGFVSTLLNAIMPGDPVGKAGPAGAAKPAPVKPDDEYTPGPDSDWSGVNPHDEETRASAPPINYADWANKNRPQKPGGDLGDEPKFFSLHRLAQILLAGAPSAVRSFDNEKAAYDNRKFRVNEREYQSKQHVQDQTWHLQVQAMKDKTEMMKAAATFAPHAAREAARPALARADEAARQLRVLLAQIPPPEKNDHRIAELEHRGAVANEEAADIINGKLGTTPTAPKK